MKKSKLLVDINKKLKLDDAFYKVHVNKRYKLKGWDFTELGEIIGLKFDYTYDKFYAEIIRDEWDRLTNLRNEFHKENLEAIVKYTKKYIELVIKQDCSYHKPLWQGLLKIKDDWTFLRVVMVNMELLWT